MTHDDFFVLAISPDEPVEDAETLAEIAAHRRECADCRKAEEDFRVFTQVLDKEPPEPASVGGGNFEEQLLAVVKETAESEKRSAALRARARGLLGSSVVGSLVVAGASWLLIMPRAMEPVAQQLAVAKPTTAARSSGPLQGERSRGGKGGASEVGLVRFALAPAECYASEAWESQETLDPESAILMLRALAEAPGASPHARLTAQLGVARCLAVLGRHEEALAVAREADETNADPEARERVRAVLEALERSTPSRRP